MKRNLCLVLILLLSYFTHGQNEMPNRKAFNLEVAVDTVNFYNQEVTESPYFVESKGLQIYPSEILLIEVELKNDLIYSMAIVKENLNPDKTIRIEFIQSVKQRVHERMVLKVQNPFDRPLKYKALMYLMGGNDWQPTTIVPVHPKLLGYEMWPDIILSLVLTEWEFDKE